MKPDPTEEETVAKLALAAEATVHLLRSQMPLSVQPVLFLLCDTPGGPVSVYASGAPREKVIKVVREWLELAERSDDEESFQ